jgi:hypothetical protein
VPVTEAEHFEVWLTRSVEGEQEALTDVIVDTGPPPLLPPPAQPPQDASTEQTIRHMVLSRRGRVRTSYGVLTRISVLTSGGKNFASHKDQSRVIEGLDDKKLCARSLLSVFL